jgi:hypothetical protein
MGHRQEITHPALATPAEPKANHAWPIASCRIVSVMRGPPVRHTRRSGCRP